MNNVIYRPEGKAILDAFNELLPWEKGEIIKHLAENEDYPDAYNGTQALNYSDKHTWSNTDGLTVTYDPEKANGGNLWSVSSASLSN